MLFRRLSFLLAAIGIASAYLLVPRLQKRHPTPAPLAEPARSPYGSAIAATGLIESASENVRIAAPRSGLVTAVKVKVGDQVKKGDALFQIDDRETRARIESMSTQLEAIKAQVLTEEIHLADAKDQLDRFQKLRQDAVASEDDLRRRWFAVESAKARWEALKAQVTASASQLEQARIDAEILTVRAPRNSEVLQVNIRGGEFATAAALNEPLMLLGNVEKLQVRCEVDEQNAVRIHPQQPAVASLKGHADLRMPLRFVRVEPYVIPKRSLTGDSLERVDTRVLQLIYELDRPAFPVYVGQQVDVFIERPSAANPTDTPRNQKPS